MILVEKKGRNIDVLGTVLPSVQFLWNFKCDLTKGRPITSFAWNRKDAVG